MQAVKSAQEMAAFFHSKVSIVTTGSAILGIRKQQKGCASLSYSSHTIRNLSRGQKELIHHYPPLDPYKETFCRKRPGTISVDDVQAHGSKFHRLLLPFSVSDES